MISILFSTNSQALILKNNYSLQRLSDSILFDSDSVFTNPDVLPSYKEGIENFMRLFLAKNLRYPEKARDKGIQGRIIVRFIVEKDGSLTNFKAANGMGFGLKEEVLRVMKLSPKWDPGLKDGKPVRASFALPVAFQLGGTPPMYTLVNGKEISESDIIKINPEKIIGVNVLSAKEARKQYGRKAENGAIIITLENESDKQ